MKRLAIFILVLISVNCFARQYSKNRKDLNYAADSMIYHMLDIYLPKVEKLTYPAVVVIYGNAWFGNNLKGIDLAGGVYICSLSANDFSSTLNVSFIETKKLMLLK